MPNGVADYRGGSVPLAEQRRELAVAQHFGGSQGEFPPQKPGVMADDDHRLAAMDGGTRVIEFSPKIERDSLSGEADVFKSEIARDETAPARSAEGNPWRSKVHYVFS